MKTLLLLALTAVITSSGLLVLTAATTDIIPPVSTGAIPVQKTMRAFSSEQELQAYLRKVAEQALQRRADADQRTGPRGLQALV